MLFCFKQKASYDVRISDWSSDVRPANFPGARKLLGDDPGFEYVWFGPEPAVFARNRARGVAVLNQQLLPGYAFFRRARRAHGIRWCEMTIGGDEAAHFPAANLIIGAVTQDRKRVVEGRRGSVLVDIGGRR